MLPSSTTINVFEYSLVGFTDAANHIQSRSVHITIEVRLVDLVTLSIHLIYPSPFMLMDGTY